MPRGGLEEYNKKRDFNITGEPKGEAGTRKEKGLAFVVQKHGARRLHYDFRLELDGVMKSWAVTRGPSYDPADKRLAVRTEDHPIEYNKFEGVIPDKQYGAGPVMIWDKGEWIPEGDPHKGLKKGHLIFDLKGNRMRGRWHLVHMRGRDEKRENWLLIKGDDDFILTGERNERYLDEENTSVISSRTLEEIKSKKPVNKGRAPSGSDKKIGILQKKYGKVELATLVEYPPDGEDWVHEIKYDGYRLLAFISDGKVVIQTRGGKDWTHKFASLEKELARLTVKDAILDGEAAVLNSKGQTSFSALQEALSNGRDEKIEAWLFDLLYLNGRDYTDRPLLERKEALAKLLKPECARLHYSEHFEGGDDILDKACKVGAEGLVSKRKNSSYHGRRTHDWVKSKCGLEQEFIICGFMPAKNNAKAVGALLLGYYKGGKLVSAGKVGTGFTQEIVKDLYKRLIVLETAKSPFSEKMPKGRRDYVWVRPELICEISFWEWTPDGHIRHASFKGLREDKSPEEVREEKPETPPAAFGRKTVKTSKKDLIIEGIAITHPDREVYPGTGITKGDIACYYAEAMPYLMPFAEGRFLSLLRCTETIAGECFFQRAPMKGGKGNVSGLTTEYNGSKHTYLYTDSPAGIIELVQMGSIEFHAWQSRVKNIEKPDQIIFDLDPADNVPFEAVKLGALDVRNRLKTYGLESFPRVTGGKGIHIVAPIKPKYTWDEIKLFTQSIALEMQRSVPDAYIATMSKEKRKGKIFVDYLRNDYSATAIVPFSLRARPGAPVAVPLSWKELEKADSAAIFNLGNIKERLNSKVQKIIDEFFSERQNLKL